MLEQTDRGDGWKVRVENEDRIFPNHIDKCFLGLNVHTSHLDCSWCES